MRLIVLSQFLQLLELLEDVAAFVRWLRDPAGVSAGVCIVSYGLLRWVQCDLPAATILAGAIAVTVYTLARQPDV